MKALQYFISIFLIVVTISFSHAQCPTVSSVTKSETSDCSGTTAQIGVVTATVGAAYQVKKDGVNFGTALVATSTSTPFWILSTTQSGTYTVVASKSGCSDVTMNGSANFTNPGPPASPSGGISLSDSPSLCSGESITLSATTGYATYQWKKNGSNISGATSTSYIASTAGTYSVLVTNSCGGSSTWSGPPISVTPTVGAPTTPSGTGSFCQGSVSTSTYTTSASNATGYNWSISPAAAGTINSSGGVTWSPEFFGTATISVSANGCNGPSVAVNKYVTVDQNIVVSSVIKSQPSDCTGSTISIGVVTATAGTTYQVKRNGEDFGQPFTAETAITPCWITTVTSEGTYTVVASKTNCGTNVPMGGEAIVSYDNTLPQGIVSIDVSPSLCEGESAALTATAGFAGYQWNKNAQPIDGATENVYQASTSGVYSVTVVNSCGLSATWQGPSISVVSTVGKPSIPNGNNILCQGADTQTAYTSTASSAADYVWSLSPEEAGTISDDGVVTWSPAFNGIASVNVVALGCNGPSEQSSRAVEIVGALGTPTVPIGLAMPCQGGSSIYTSFAANAQAYSWQLFNAGESKLTDKGYTSTSSSAAVLWDTHFTGQAIIQVTAMTTSGCNHVPTTASLTVNVQPTLGTALITAGPVNYCAGSDEIVDFEAFAENASNYQWFLEPGTAGAVNGSGIVTFDPSYRGTAVVQVTAAGCNESTTTASVKIDVLDPPACLNNYNYIRSYTAKVEGLMESIETLPQNDRSEIAQYFDGLGRSMQTVTTQGSPAGNDLVQPIAYDAYGREAIQYLPYASTTDNGFYKLNALSVSDSYLNSPQHTFYNNAASDEIAVDDKPYAETVFEASPLDRVLKQGAPGTAWQPNEVPASDHSVKKEYGFNQQDKVILFDYDEVTASIHFTENGALKYYEPNQLYANKTFDEQNHEVIEYVDKEGKTVLKKVQYEEINGVKHYTQTYYIYDDLGNLRVVLPPEASAALSASMDEQ